MPVNNHITTIASEKTDYTNNNSARGDNQNKGLKSSGLA